LRATLPSDASTASLRSFAREMWNRNGYGDAAMNLIADRPLTGVGIGLFNLSGSADARARGLNLPADNAQNWWRHHVAELGLLGAAGLLLWTAVFLAFLSRTAGVGGRAVPAAALKGALIGFGVVSLVGMPAQSLPVTMTFWTYAFWYTRLTAPASDDECVVDPRPSSWVLLVTLVGVYGVSLLVLARGQQRPAMRAAAGQWRYTYGIYDPGIPLDGQTLRWTERHGVAVVRNDGPWMILTVRAEHPDVRDRPVHAVVEVNGRTVVDASLETDDPVIHAIETGSASRAIVETRVDRTWRPPGTPARHPDVGLSLSWSFAHVRPQGVPVVTAPLRR